MYNIHPEGGIRSRLSFKLAIILLTFLISFFLILAYLIGKRERDLLIAFDKEKSALLADSLTEVLRETMLEKDPSVFKRILDKADSLGDIRITVLRSNRSWFYGDPKLTFPKDMLSQAEKPSIEKKDRLIFLSHSLMRKDVINVIILKKSLEALSYSVTLQRLRNSRQRLETNRDLRQWVK